MNLRDNSIDLVSFNKLFTEYHERFVRFAYTYVVKFWVVEVLVWKPQSLLLGKQDPFVWSESSCLYFYYN